MVVVVVVDDDAVVTLFTIRLQVSLTGRHENVACYPPHPPKHGGQHPQDITSNDSTMGHPYAINLTTCK